MNGNVPVSPLEDMLEERVDGALVCIAGTIDADVLADPEAPDEAKALAVAFLVGAMAMADAVTGGYDALSTLGAYKDAAVAGALVMGGACDEVRAVRCA